MPSCPSCGSENRAGARFCDACGARLDVPAAAPGEQRKTVTVLFCDVTGSTALGERLDPESLRRVLALYFEEARAAVERHGGTVEKFVGDAVMAVFGVPHVHEDDALRAVRAAAELRGALASLNEQLRRDYGTTLAVRMGVNTGEVVTGTEERLATGDAVNVAARLEQAAEPGEILVGEETFRLVRDVARVEPVVPLAVKGKRARVTAHRLFDVADRQPARRLDAPMVGRERELLLLLGAWERVVSERSCHLFSLLGSAGVGKSRLAEELLSRLAGARVVRGRCLAYGEGITYWPAVELLRQLPELATLELEPSARRAVTSLLGGSTGVASTDEIAWAVRKTLEAVAAAEPVVCVLDDVHWGEEAFLDLVEHVADLSRGAPILLLCMARPELLDRRPGWGGGKLNASTVLLEPLAPDETDALIERLAAGAPLDEGLRARIRDTAEGNPLFVEEMLAMVRESPGREIEVPPTIHALLAARLDQLDPSERSVLERGAVEGRVFHRAGLQALAPDEAEPGPRLVSLVRKELVRPEPAQLPGDEAYRFRHQLIRDAAYEALPKAARAELHERFADWLASAGAALVELDELLGHHLERAFRYRAELGPVDDHARALAARARARLAASGRLALERGDVTAAIGLLERVLDLPGEPDPDIGLALAEALFAAGRLADASACAEAVATEAAARGDPVAEWRARLDATRLAANADVTWTAEKLLGLVEQARPAIEGSGDDRALGALAMAELWAGNVLAQYERVTGAARRAAGHARRAGDGWREVAALTWLALATYLGPMPARDALRVLDDPELGPHVPFWSSAKALVLGLVGRFDEARALLLDERARVSELGRHLDGALSASNLGLVEAMAGDDETAARWLREGCAGMTALGEQAYLSTYVAELGRVLYRLGDVEGASDCADRSAEAGAADDLVTQMLWRQLRANVLARRGRHDEALALAREAVDVGRATDALVQRALTHADLADVHELAGRPDAAVAELEHAVELFERKGAAAPAAQARSRLAGLDGARA